MVVIVEKRNDLFLSIVVSLIILFSCCFFTYTIFVEIPQVVKEHNEKAKQGYMDGVNSFKNGVPAEANPYTRDQQRTAWLNGWMDEKSKLHK